ncbi:hypothetical protein SNEBB_001192 [Seison nebaliae]|nr:hypothetical protein SNEBB_001192 [Seison nebaliae]
MEQKPAVQFNQNILVKERIRQLAQNIFWNSGNNTDNDVEDELHIIDKRNIEEKTSLEEVDYNCTPKSNFKNNIAFFNSIQQQQQQIPNKQTNYYNQAEYIDLYQRQQPQNSVCQNANVVEASSASDGIDNDDVSNQYYQTTKIVSNIFSLQKKHQKEEEYRQLSNDFLQQSYNVYNRDNNNNIIYNTVSRSNNFHKPLHKSNSNQLSGTNNKNPLAYLYTNNSIKKRNSAFIPSTIPINSTLLIPEKLKTPTPSIDTSYDHQSDFKSTITRNKSLQILSSLSTNRNNYNILIPNSANNNFIDQSTSVQIKEQTNTNNNNNCNLTNNNNHNNKNNYDYFYNNNSNTNNNNSQSNQFQVPVNRKRDSIATLYETNEKFEKDNQYYQIVNNADVRKLGTFATLRYSKKSATLLKNSLQHYAQQKELLTNDIEPIDYQSNYYPHKNKNFSTDFLIYPNDNTRKIVNSDRTRENGGIVQRNVYEKPLYYTPRRLQHYNSHPTLTLERTSGHRTKLINQILPKISPITQFPLFHLETKNSHCNTDNPNTRKSVVEKKRNCLKKIVRRSHTVCGNRILDKLSRNPSKHSKHDYPLSPSNGNHSETCDTYEIKKIDKQTSQTNIKSPILRDQLYTSRPQTSRSSLNSSIVHRQTEKIFPVNYKQNQPSYFEILKSKFEREHTQLGKKCIDQNKNKNIIWERTNETIRNLQRSRSQDVPSNQKQLDHFNLEDELNIHESKEKNANRNRPVNKEINDRNFFENNHHHQCEKIIGTTNKNKNQNKMDVLPVSNTIFQDIKSVPCNSIVTDVQLSSRESNENALDEKSDINSNCNQQKNKIMIPYIKLNIRDEVGRFPHTKRVGNYLLGKKLGEGSFAKVKEGLHLLSGQHVAIKVIDKRKAKEDPYVSKNMRREGKLLQLVKHDNIVQLYELMETENSYYLVMELCDGGDLMDFICAKKHLDEKLTQKFIKQIMSAINYLHLIGILHRDLKIENLLLDKHNNIKLIDFGLSNLIKKGECITQCGSPAYAAPELLAHKKYDHKVDVWSIGVNMYAMLTGNLPYTVEPFNIKTLYNKMIKGEINKLPENLSKNGIDLLMKLLTADPVKRITLIEAMKHHWISSHNTDNDNNNNNNLMMESLLTKSSLSNGKINESKYNQTVLHHMTTHMSFRLTDILQNLQTNHASSTLATYSLLVRKLMNADANKENIIIYKEHAVVPQKVTSPPLNSKPPMGLIGDNKDITKTVTPRPPIITKNEKDNRNSQVVVKRRCRSISQNKTKTLSVSIGDKPVIKERKISFIQQNHLNGKNAATNLQRHKSESYSVQKRPPQKSNKNESKMTNDEKSDSEKSNVTSKYHAHGHNEPQRTMTMQNIPMTSPNKMEGNKRNSFTLKNLVPFTPDINKRNFTNDNSTTKDSTEKNGKTKAQFLSRRATKTRIQRPISTMVLQNENEVNGNKNHQMSNNNHTRYSHNQRPNPDPQTVVRNEKNLNTKNPSPSVSAFNISNRVKLLAAKFRQQSIDQKENNVQRCANLNNNNNNNNLNVICTSDEEESLANCDDSINSSEMTKRQFYSNEKTFQLQSNKLNGEVHPHEKLIYNSPESILFANGNSQPHKLGDMTVDMARERMKNNGQKYSEFLSPTSLSDKQKMNSKTSEKKTNSNAYCNIYEKKHPTSTITGTHSMRQRNSSNQSNRIYIPKTQSKLLTNQQQSKYYKQIKLQHQQQHQQNSSANKKLSNESKRYSLAFNPTTEIVINRNVNKKSLSPSTISSKQTFHTKALTISLEKNNSTRIQSDNISNENNSTISNNSMYPSENDPPHSTNQQQKMNKVKSINRYGQLNLNYRYVHSENPSKLNEMFTNSPQNCKEENWQNSKENSPKKPMEMFQANAEYLDKLRNTTTSKFKVEKHNKILSPDFLPNKQLKKYSGENQNKTAGITSKLHREKREHVLHLNEDDSPRVKEETNQNHNGNHHHQNNNIKYRTESHDTHCGRVGVGRVSRPKSSLMPLTVEQQQNNPTIFQNNRNSKRDSSNSLSISDNSQSSLSTKNGNGNRTNTNNSRNKGNSNNYQYNYYSNKQQKHDSMSKSTYTPTTYNNSVKPSRTTLINDMLNPIVETKQEKRPHISMTSSGISSNEITTTTTTFNQSIQDKFANHNDSINIERKWQNGNDDNTAIALQQKRKYNSDSGNQLSAGSSIQSTCI